MSNISTRICTAAAVEVGPVKFQEVYPGGNQSPHLVAVQHLQIALHDGGSFELAIQLLDGCCCLETGDPVEIPEVFANERAIK